MSRWTLWTWIALTGCGPDPEPPSDRTAGRGNLAPSATLLSLVPGPPGDADTPVRVEAQVVDAEDGPQALVLRWESDRSGPLAVDATPDADGFVRGVVDLVRGVHEITLEVEDSLGRTGSDRATIAVGGVTAPTVRIGSPADDAVVRPGPVPLEAQVDEPDQDPTSLAVRWESNVDGLLSTARPDPGGQIADEVSALSRGRHVLTLSVSGADGLVGTDAVLITVNDAPAAPEVSIVPTDPRTVDDLVAVVDAPGVDPEGDPVTHAFAWTRDGATAGVSATVPATDTARDQRWVVTVTPSDPHGPGTPATAEVWILNSPPTAPVVRVSPAVPVTTDDLDCLVDAPAWDADGDPLGLTFAWEVDGFPFAAAAAMVPAADTAPLEVWTCSVAADDGFELGPAGVASVTICSVEPEVCDGVDNDCDGVVDGPLACARRVFVTAGAVSADFGGALGADALCQDAADDAGLGGAWMAWVSDSTTSPAARFRQGTDDFVRLDGALVATGWSDLTDGTLAVPIDIDEYGMPQGNHEVWTHTSTSGTALFGTPCDDWTNRTGSRFAQQGLSADTDWRWTSAYLQVCDRTDDHLYCFEQ